MANEQNLVPANKRTESELRAMTQKGGIASGEARRKKKTLRELAEMLGQLKVTDEKVVAKMKEAGLEPDSFTHDMAIMVKQYELAEKDDMKSTSAAQFIRDTKGESPKNTEFNINADVKSIQINFGLNGEKESGKLS